MWFNHEIEGILPRKIVIYSWNMGMVWIGTQVLRISPSGWWNVQQKLLGLLVSEFSPFFLPLWTFLQVGSPFTSMANHCFCLGIFYLYQHGHILGRDLPVLYKSMSYYWLYDLITAPCYPHIPMKCLRSSSPCLFLTSHSFPLSPHFWCLNFHYSCSHRIFSWWYPQFLGPTIIIE